MPQIRIVVERIQFQDQVSMASGNFYQKTSKRATKVVGNPISYRVRVRTHHIGGRREVPGKKKSLGRALAGSRLSLSRIFKTKSGSHDGDCISFL